MRKWRLILLLGSLLFLTQPSLAFATSELIVHYPLGPQKILSLCGNGKSLSWTAAFATPGRETSPGSGIWKFELGTETSEFQGKLLITDISNAVDPIWMSGPNFTVQPDQILELTHVDFQFPEGKIETHVIPTRGPWSEKTLRVYVPPPQGAPAHALPVIYALDGQNLFRAGSARANWELDRTFDEFIARGLIDPMMIVGIEAAPNRVDEYTFVSDPRYAAKNLPIGGLGKRFAEETYPSIVDWVEDHPGWKAAKTANHRYLLGSSLAGFEATYMGLAKNPKPVLKVISPSSSYWWFDEYLPKHLSEMELTPVLPTLVISMGTEEGGANASDTKQALEGYRSMIRELKKIGYGEGRNLFHAEVLNGAHSEVDWAAWMRTQLPVIFSRTMTRAERCNAIFLRKAN